MCECPAGHNVEYLLRLAEFMQEKVPEGYDAHLATLEQLVRIRIKEKNLCLKSLMGEGQQPQGGLPNGAGGPPNRAGGPPNRAGGPPRRAGQLPEAQAVEERRDTFQYSAQLPPKKLRCLNV
ncbi:uncharacterized protein [Procambarus clarkii]|uniref:uncharacterized protein n=1 Tax=Procambarus clarkii TaxID=6728 RepID=UPI0037437C78